MAYRMIIIDDEPYVRTQLRTCLNWEHFDIELAGEADNGLDAVSLIEKTRPHIVICDIHMPYMDGVSFAQYLHEKAPNTQIIFISAYSDPEHMQQAIRLNVVDYLFKPFKLSDLSAAVEAAIARLKSASDSVFTSETQRVIHLLDGIESAKSVQEMSFSPPLRIDLETAYFCFVARSADAQTETGEAETLSARIARQNSRSAFVKSFEELMDSVFCGCYEASWVGGSYVAYVTPRPQMSIDDILLELAPLCSRDSRGNFSIGISRLFCSVSAVHTALNEARLASLSAFYFGFDRIHSSAPEHKYTPGHEALAAVKKAAAAGNRAEAFEAFDEYCTYVSHCSPENIPLVKRELGDFIGSLTDESGYTPDIPAEQFINGVRALAEVKSFVQEMISCIAMPKTQDNGNRLVAKAEKYILDNLDRPLTVKEIAGSIYVSHTYLCYLYKKTTGNTINTFIIEAKMKRAKSLLVNTDIKIGEISSMLGFSNQNYFSKVFIKYYGLSPRDCRAENR